MKPLHYHFIGIKGVGMTALALCAQDKGIEVTGWDVDEHFVTDEILQKRHISWSTDPAIPSKPDLIIMTAAHGGMQNPQVTLAQSMGLPVVSYAEALGMMMRNKVGISVCGVGGKTTTSAMLATILDRAGIHPSYVVGVGNIPSLGSPGRFDDLGKFFVTEADEYAISPGIDNRPKFIFQKPQAIVVTNIERDHPDIYPTLESIQKVYQDFISTLPTNGLLVAQIDNPHTAQAVRALSSTPDLTTIGFSPLAQWRIIDTHIAQETMFIKLSIAKIEEKLLLNIPGDYNAVNAVSASAVTSHFGVSWAKIQQGLAEFMGTKRRFEFIGEAAGVKLYDDYAHHPTEVKAVIKAARDWFPGKKLIVAFQPHTYSRTKALFKDFTKAFLGADHLLLTDIYASKREAEDTTVNSQILADEIKKYQKGVKYIGAKEKLSAELAAVATRGTIIITMGAGDIFHTHQEILDSIS